MASAKKITELTANTSPAMGDYIPMVDDPAGTPATQRTTFQYAANLIRSNNLIYTALELKQIDTTSSETSITPATGSGSLTLAANYLTVAKHMRVHAAGWLDSTGSPTLTWRFKIGGSTFLDSGAVTAGPDFNDVYWSMDIDWAIYTIGATATHALQGRIFMGATVIPFGTTGFNVINSTGTLALLTTIQWSASSASNVFNLSNYTVTATN